MPPGNTVLPAYYGYSRPELRQLVDPRGKRILEVGCAAGALGRELIASGAREVVGLDYHEPAIALARERLTAAHRVDLNTLPELPYPAGHFDFLVFADVLEHLVDPAAVLRHLRRWLRDDGAILVSIPNVRHESVLLPLLVNGCWDYVDAGILDRTHLRFFTLGGVLKLLADAGFALEGKMAGVHDGPSPYVQKVAELVAALGGDARTFIAECNVVQFVFLARPIEQLARDAAPAQAAGPWAGARAVCVLFAPTLDAPDDCWASALPVLARGISGNAGVTIGLALPEYALAAPPAPVAALLREGLDLDLVLTQRPSTAAGWAALVGGTSLIVLTSAQPELEHAARAAGVELRDARGDPKLCGATGAVP